MPVLPPPLTAAEYAPQETAQQATAARLAAARPDQPEESLECGDASCHLLDQFGVILHQILRGLQQVAMGQFIDIGGIETDLPP